MGVCKRQVRHVDLNSLQSVAVGINLPALENSAKDSERRRLVQNDKMNLIKYNFRQKALKELNERLNKTRTAEVANYGNWDEDENDEPSSVTVVSPQSSNVHSSRVATEPEKESMA